jgi:DNA-binding NtrC family response regulator
MNDIRVLLLESDPSARETIRAVLADEGLQVRAVGVGPEALEAIGELDHDAVLVSMADGLDINVWLHSIKQRTPGMPVLVLAEPDRVVAAVEALTAGADDYMLRPPGAAEIRVRLGRILERNELGSRVAFFQDELSKKAEFTGPEVESPAMRGVLERIRRVAPMRSTVLVQGESGVGKELVARAIHFDSPRRDHPFVALNCAAMPGNLIESDLFGHEKGAFTGAHIRSRGKFEIANGGTLFLDEIGEMEISTQAKLLRVLEEREFMRIGGERSIQVDVRVIAATNANLESMVAESRFRQDLYYRLKVVTIRVPPLRERRQDTPRLIETFLEQLARANAVPRKTISSDAVRVLSDYEWPGNVRELKNVLESVLVSTQGSSIGASDLPSAIRGQPARREALDLLPGMTIEEAERELIRRTLVHAGGNRTHSADLLGIGVRTLQRKIRTYGIEITSRRRRPRRARRVD